MVDIESRLRVMTFSANLQHYIQAELFVKARGIGIVVSSTWFLFRWKQHFIDNYISRHKIDEVIPHLDFRNARRFENGLISASQKYSMTGSSGPQLEVQVTPASLVLLHI